MPEFIRDGKIHSIDYPDYARFIADRHQSRSIHACASI